MFGRIDERAIQLMRCDNELFNCAHLCPEMTLIAQAIQTVYRGVADKKREIVAIVDRNSKKFLWFVM